MSTFVKDLMDEDLVMDMLEQGYLREQTHPRYPYAILNYSEKAVFEKVWNEATLQCRGLIYNYETKEVVARPFPKFFNYGEHKSEDIPTGSVQVFDKVDGSLGILYPTPDGQWAIATRGSFASEQAIKATEILRTKYADWEPCCEGRATFLFEIIYPENRIVLDYAGQEDLILLDVIDHETGQSDWFDGFDPHRYGWEGPEVQRFEYTTLAEALTAEPRPNAEGFVVLFEDDTRLKIKQEDYVRLHAVVTNTSSRTVWEALRNGDDLSTLFTEVPDEFREWVEDVAMNLEGSFHALFDHVWDTFHRIWFGLEDNTNRKAFAERALQTPYSAEMFALYDDRSIDDLIWKRIRPERTLPYRSEK